MKITKILLIILFFSLPLIHGRIFPTVGIELYFNVSGNFEFTKAMFFNVFSGIIFLIFFVEKFILKNKYVAPFSFERERIQDRVILGIILLILFLSTIFSVSPFTSIIGDLEKGHTALMFMNLLGLFIVLKNLEKTFLKKLILTSLLAGVCVSLLAIKELYFQTYDYGALGNRALGSFGHPNYLAGYLLLLLPFYCSPFPFPKDKGRKECLHDYSEVELKERIQVWIRIICIIILLSAILFSKSLVAIVLAVGYLVYIFIPSPLRRGLGGGMILITILGVFILTAYFPEKLHSFLSRFYLWETTLRIIFSDIKIFLIGGGAETLPYFFDSFKVPETYIFENFGFTADRPHNFALNIFYHFGVFALGFFLYLVYLFTKVFKNTPENIALVLFLLFGIIHYFSIAGYTLVVLILAVTYKTPLSILSCQERGKHKKMKLIPSPRRRGLGRGILLILTLLSLTGVYYSIKLYQSEILYTKGLYIEASENFSHPKYLIKTGDYSGANILEGINSKQNIKQQIMLSPEKQTHCNSLTINYPSAENHIYCGNIFWNLGKHDLAREYYNSGLSKLPDLWNKDSPYWDNYFIKNTITGNRFFSEKFGNINGVLERVNY